MKNKKYRLLRTGLLYDAIGLATLAIPVAGPFIDLVWAPIAAKKMMELYPGKKGKTAAAITFLEEVLPFSDWIPTFTLMWLYTFLWKKESVEEATVIEAEVAV